MSYDPNVLNGDPIVSASQNGMNTNFEQINSVMNNDHFPYNDGTSTKRGRHRKISFPDNLGAYGSLGSFVSALFPDADSKDTSERSQLYFKNQQGGGTTFQITNRFYEPSATAGYYMLPGGSTGNPGLIIMWGSILAATFSDSTTGSRVVNYDFPTMSNYTGGGYTNGFPNNAYGFWGIVEASDVQNKVVKFSTMSKTKLNVWCSANKADFVTVKWIAIGN